MKRGKSVSVLLTACLLCMSVLFSAHAQRYETLRPGAQGEAVHALQSGLKALGYPVEVDGKYGRQTSQFVSAFQRQNRLTADGLAGDRTLTELYRQVPQFKPDSPQAGVNTPPPSSPSSPTTQPETGASGAAYVYTSNRGALNVRNQPKYGQTTIGQLPFGTQVTILSTTGSWTRIRVNGLEGFVVSSFLRQDPVATPAPGTSSPAPTATPAPALPTSPPPASSGSALVITGNRGSLNLRDRASYSGTAILQIPYQETVQVHSRKGAWTQVTYQGVTGFVVDSFLRHQTGQNPLPTESPTPVASPTEQPTEVPRPTEQPTAAPGQQGTAFVNTAGKRTLNFRSTPNTGNNIIGQLPSGEALLLINRGDTWCEVIYNGRQGFVMTSFLRFPTEPTTSPTAAPTETPTQAPTQAPAETPTPSPSPTAAPTEAPLFPRTLRPGDRGEDVLELQTRLIALKYTVSKTSAYDAMTQEAVRHFQLQNSLTVDGLFGSNTAQILLSGSARAADSPALSYKTLRIDQRDGSDKAITRMQEALKNLGFPLTVNGRYDIPTHQAVVGFQQRNDLPITGIANPHTQATIFSGGAKGYATPVAELGAGEGKGEGPSSSQVKLLHWFNDIKPRVAAGQRVTVHHPASGISFTIRFYSMGNHADSEPDTWRDTQLMNRAFGTPSWNINTVYIKLPDGQWTLAAMHNRPHLSGAINANGFGGHLCIHFLRDTDEVNKNDPDYGASNQRAIRKAWKGMTGEDVE